MTISSVSSPIALNEAEAIIEPFWDERLSRLAGCTLQGVHGASPRTSWVPAQTPASPRVSPPEVAPSLGPLLSDQVRANQIWGFVILAWDRPRRLQADGKQSAERAADPVLSLSRELRVDLSGYDRLVVRMACPKHVRLTVVATVDGVKRTIIDAELGFGKAHEYEGRVRGRILERIRLEVASEHDGADEAWLYWVGCANVRKRRAMLARTSPFTPDWEGWLLPEGTTVDYAPRFGFFFGTEEMEALRRKALSPLYQPIMDQLRTLARDAMNATCTPENQIGPIIGMGEVYALYMRERDANTRSFHVDAPVCAFVGLIDKDPACLRFAARIAMSLAHTTHWAPHFMQSFPGSTWDSRGFPEAFATAGVALTLDWAGAWFTPKGEHLVRYAIATKGLPRIREVFLQYEYMWNSNQHHMIGLGRLLGLLVLQKAWPRTMAEIDVFERDLYEIIDRYIQSDGTTNEGMGYWSNSFRTTLPSLAALARFRGKTLQAMVPPKLRSMDGYIASLLSTAGEAGSYLPIADTVGDAVALDAIGVMAAALGTPLWMGLLADAFQRGKQVKRDWSFDGLFTVIHGPERCPQEKFELPAFMKLPKLGMASSFRRLNGEAFRLFLVGAVESGEREKSLEKGSGGRAGGHGHRDKGSFILEAGGEPFAIDRGSVPYEDTTNMSFMKGELAHNLAIPDGCTQQGPPPYAADWVAKGDETSLIAEVDTGGTWLPPVLACRRIIRSPSPDRIEITDEFELAEPRAVTFYLHSPLPIHVNKGNAEIRGTRLTLEVSADWAFAGTMETCGVNWCYTPINRLALTSTPARRHRLTTMLSFKHREGYSAE